MSNVLRYFIARRCRRKLFDLLGNEERSSGSRISIGNGQAGIGRTEEACRKFKKANQELS